MSQGSERGNNITQAALVKSVTLSPSLLMRLLLLYILVSRSCLLFSAQALLHLTAPNQLFLLLFFFCNI